MPTARTCSATSAHDALTPRQRSRFAMEWFSQLADHPDVCALGVRPERAAHQLLHAPLRRDPSRVCFARLALADVALACACVDDHEDAWAMVDGHAPLLQRALMSLYEREHPHVAARRFLDRVRVSTVLNDDAPENLRRYSGERPLRVWLVDRLLGAHAGALRTLRAPSPSNRLRLAFELIETKREHARAMLEAMDTPAKVGRLLADPN